MILALVRNGVPVTATAAFLLLNAPARAGDCHAETLPGLGLQWLGGSSAS